ncbi:hypothetical protein ACLK1V_15665 [Escherichia coli]
MKSIVDPSALVIDLGAQKRPTVISVVGAGGKTSLLFWLAELLQASGRRVLNHDDDTYVYANVSLARGFLS